jgi:hypothetical protein
MSKYRLGLIDNLAPVIRHLMPPHHHGSIGFDTIEVSPRDKFGNLYIDIIVNHTSKLANFFAPVHVLLRVV